MSCGADKNKNNNAKKTNKPVAKDIELKPALTDEQEETSLAKTDAKPTETSPPMTQQQLSLAKELINKTDKAKVKAVDAAKIFKMRCSSCHGFKGNMMVNGAKDLTKSKISLTESVAQAYFGKGLMTPFKDVLKDEEIVAVAKYIEKELRK